MCVCERERERERERETHPCKCSPLVCNQLPHKSTITIQFFLAFMVLSYYVHRLISCGQAKVGEERYIYIPVATLTPPE